jgi:uncharacterized protein YndB with AHSA1/START domain
MKAASTDRIEKHVHLPAPRSRVWRALTDSKEFGSWFQIRFADPFRAGATLKGQITFPRFEHLTVTFVIEQLVPERLFSYRWHPHAIDPKHDYSSEPMTLVEFSLTDAGAGTDLTVTESGFDGIPIERRLTALTGNDEGWAIQVNRVRDYVLANP